MSLGVKTLAVVLALGSPVAAKMQPRRRAAVRVLPAAAQVIGVMREEVLELPVGTGAQVRALPGALGLEIEIGVPHGAIDDILDAVPEPWRIDVRALEGATRIRVVHPRPPVVFASTQAGFVLRVAFGTADEQTRLRRLATLVRMPLPEPEDLGSELEVWQDAERAMAAGDLSEAKRLWERLADVPRLADLASLRVAELFIASGHINEALSQLRDVSRLHPRSVGAALARLDVLHLETLTGQATPTVSQVDVAAGSLERAAFDTFARVRAALVLREIGDAPAALARLPDGAPLPAVWRDAASALRQDLVAAAVIGPLLLGDPRATAAAWDRWSTKVGTLAEQDAINDMVAEAHEALGLFEIALPMLQSRLRNSPRPALEADLVGRVAHAYRMLDDVERASFALDFQLAAHPDAPGLVAGIGAIAIRRCVRDGLASARGWLAGARKRAASPATSRAIDDIEAELVLGWGTPAQIVHSLGGESDGTMHPTHDDPVTATRHARALAVALVRVGRHARGAEMLRELAGRTADPSERDRLSYYLGVAEHGLGHVADADAIFRHISTHGTTYGQLAIARLQERRLQTTVDALVATAGGASR